MRKADKNSIFLNKELLLKTQKEIMTLFLHLETSEAIKQGLEHMKDFFKADRVFIGYFDEENTHLDLLCESCSEGVDKLSSVFNSDFSRIVFVKDSEYSWWLNNLKSGKDTVIDNTNETPDEWRPLVSKMRENKVKSMLTTPVYGDKHIAGFLGVEFLNNFYFWTDADLENVHFFSNLFSIAIEKELVYKKAEDSQKELLRGNALFQLVFQTLPIGIEVYDEKGYLIDINPYGLELLGATKNDVLGVNIFKNPIISPEDKDSIKQGIITDVNNDYVYNTITEKRFFKTKFRNRKIRLNGRYLPLKNKLGQIYGYLALVHHDESFYLHKEELRANLVKLQLAVNSADSFLWDYDIQNDKVTVDNNFLGANKEHWFRLLYKEDKKREGHFTHIHEDDVENVREGIEKLVRGEIPFFTMKYRQYMGDGNLYWLSSNFTIYKWDENNNPTNLICLTTDVTGQQEKEIELFKAREAVAVKSAIIDNISHEIRTPLNIIVGFANILAESNESVENQYMVDLIYENNSQLLELIDNVLSFSQITKRNLKYNIEIVDVKQLCEEAFKIKCNTKKSGNKFIFDDNRPSYKVRVDKNRIIQVLYMLLDNANKYTNNGMISLSYCLDTPKTIRIEVKDTGLGLTREEINNLTLRFFKVNSFSRGLGLGIPLSRGIVEDMGGTFDIISKKGEGSVFGVILPLYISE